MVLAVAEGKDTCAEFEEPGKRAASRREGRAERRHHVSQSHSIADVPALLEKVLRDTLAPWVGSARIENVARNYASNMSLSHKFCFVPHR
jgi:hypothetical protein